MKSAFLILLNFLIIQSILYGQNLEEIGVKKGVGIKGSVSLNAIGYKAWGIQSRRDPFTWYASGNLNLNLFGYSAPFSFSYSNANRSFSQPFNQFSFAPQYKWVKVYIGYNSMNFSSYTLAGHVFLGGGVELSPGKWRIAAMYGRLKKAVPYNLSDSTTHYNASFKRIGYGLKLGYDDGGNAIYTSIFAAKDDTTSIPFILNDGQLTPKENLVIGVSGRKKFLKRFFVEGEYAYSILNNDMRSVRIDSGAIVNPPAGGIIESSNTTRYFNAYNGSVGYQGNWYSIQLKYERIDPEYQTLGAYYFNNDLQNITIAPSLQLFQSKLNIAGNVGFQKNNLDHTKESTTKRFVGSTSATFVPNEQWAFTGSYSNFSTYTNIRLLTDPFFRDNLDTLNFYQINNTWNASSNYNFGSKEKKQGVMLNVSYQKATDISAYEGGSNSSDFYTGNLSYTYSLTPINTTLSTGFNYYTSFLPGIRTDYWGPSFTASKSFFEKVLKGSFSSSFNKNSTNGVTSSSILNSRVSLNYLPKSNQMEEKKNPSTHNISLGINFLQKFANKGLEENNKAFTELTGNFTYTYSF